MFLCLNLSIQIMQSALFHSLNVKPLNYLISFSKPFISNAPKLFTTLTCITQYSGLFIMPLSTKTFLYSLARMVSIIVFISNLVLNSLHLCQSLSLKVCGTIFSLKRHNAVPPCQAEYRAVP